MNTSMTINATAAWLLALYVACAETQGIARDQLSGTTQNDIIKEYLSRGTYIFPPAPSMRLITDVVSFTYDRRCQSGTRPTSAPTTCRRPARRRCRSLAYALATAIAVLDAVKASGQVPEADFPKVVGRISFFVNAGLRFVTEMCKMRAFTEMWDRNLPRALRRRGGTLPALPLWRAGEFPGPDRAAAGKQRLSHLLEMLAVTLSKSARARAVQLPAWNEALGLPRPWDQQWSLRMQQIVAFETDLLEFGDIFDGSHEIAAKVARPWWRKPEAELAEIERLGGAVSAVESSYMKERLVESATRRFQAIEAGEQVVVGVNAYQESEASPS